MAVAHTIESPQRLATRSSPAAAATRAAPARAQVTVLDWGIGGVALLQRLREARPDLTLRYRSDSGFAPWGAVPTQTLTRRLDAIVAQERAAGSTGVLIACNAASTVLSRLDRVEGDLPRGLPHGLHGVITPGVAAALKQGWRHVGLVGGARTVRSGAWANALRAAGVKVTQRIAQPLSARIEAGDIDGPETRALVMDLCQPLRRCEAVILACTHYPAASAAFVAALPGVALFDPAPAALAALLRALPPVPSRPGSSPAGPSTAGQRGDAPAGTLVAVTTGDPGATATAARRAFGVDLGVVRAIQLSGSGSASRGGRTWVSG